MLIQEDKIILHTVFILIPIKKSHIILYFMTGIPSRIGSFVGIVMEKFFSVVENKYLINCKN